MNFRYYKIEPVLPGVTRIRCAAGELCYLVEGEKEAALIDTGSGYAGLDETVRKLTELPVNVILTHAHRDHSGGIVQFRSACVHPADTELLSLIKDESFRTGYPRSLKPKLFKNMDAAEFPKMYEPEIRFVREGNVIDLGGTKLEIWETPGHTQGSICVCDTARRLLFTGDTVISCALLCFEVSTDVATYKKSLEMIKSRDGMYDRTFCAHFGGEVPPDGTERLIACCDDILDGRDSHFGSRMFGRNCWAAFEPSAIPTVRRDGGWGNIFYK